MDRNPAKSKEEGWLTAEQPICLVKLISAIWTSVCTTGATAQFTTTAVEQDLVGILIRHQTTRKGFLPKQHWWERRSEVKAERKNEVCVRRLRHICSFIMISKGRKKLTKFNECWISPRSQWMLVGFAAVVTTLKGWWTHAGLWQRNKKPYSCKCSTSELCCMRHHHYIIFFSSPSITRNREIGHGL